MALGLVLGALSGGAAAAGQSLAQSDQLEREKELSRQRLDMQLEAQRVAEEMKNRPKQAFGQYLGAAQQQLAASGANPDSSEILRSALNLAIQNKDAEALEFGKKMLTDTRVNVGPDSIIYDLASGKKEYESTRGQERAEVAAQAAAAKRAEDQQFKREEAEKERQFRREQEASRQASSREMAQIMAGAKKEAANEKEENKPIPKAIVNEIKDARNNAVNINRAANSFKDDFASKGILGFGADKQLSASAVLGVDKEAVDWWKNYRKDIELVERHEKFGAALTTSELQSWKSADISPGLDPSVIRKNLELRSRLAQKVLEFTRDDYIDAGYNAKRINLIAGRDTSEIGGQKPAERNQPANNIPQGWSVTVR